MNYQKPQKMLGTKIFWKFQMVGICVINNIVSGQWTICIKTFGKNSTINPSNIIYKTNNWIEMVVKLRTSCVACCTQLLRFCEKRYVHRVNTPSKLGFLLSRKFFSCSNKVIGGRLDINSHEIFLQDRKCSVKKHF